MNLLFADVVELSSNQTLSCIVCIESSDIYIKSRFPNEKDYTERIGQYYDGQVWNRIDILPIPCYLAQFRNALFNFGGVKLHSQEIDNSTIADGKTSIRDYLRRSPEVACCDMLWDLSDLHLTDTDLESLKELSLKYESLYLCHNSITKIPLWVCSHAALTNLALHQNNIKEIPIEIGQLKQLTSLRLDNNDIESLPDSLCELEQLEVLHVMENHIRKLPVNIGNLTSLVDLGLAGNPIEALPLSICNMDANKTLIWGVEREFLKQQDKWDILDLQSTQTIQNKLKTLYQ